VSLASGSRWAHAEIQHIGAQFDQTAAFAGCGAVTVVLG